MFKGELRWIRVQFLLNLSAELIDGQQNSFILLIGYFCKIIKFVFLNFFWNLFLAVFQIQTIAYTLPLWCVYQFCTIISWESQSSTWIVLSWIRDQSGLDIETSDLINLL